MHTHLKRTLLAAVTSGLPFTSLTGTAGARGGGYGNSSWSGR